ncbi:MAG TPA: hypothetical protein VE155_06355, partial [Pseudonocardiaceae bacterium]|nr:hypothetical protein [Pseudonocardiaceae bacterium]
MDDERGLGRMLNLIEPLPVGDDCPADDQASQRKYDTGAAVLGFGESVDRPDHGLQRLVNLRHTRSLSHVKIIHPPRPRPGTAAGGDQARAALDRYPGASWRPMPSRSPTGKTLPNWPGQLGADDPDTRVRRRRVRRYGVAGD